jgi:hypothetical protein
VKKNSKYAILTGITEYLTELQKKSMELDRDIQSNIQNTLHTEKGDVRRSSTGPGGPRGSESDLFALLGKVQSSGFPGSGSLVDGVDKERVSYFLQGGGDFQYR